MRINEKTPKTEYDFDYIDELEKEWRQSIPKLTDRDLLEVFPEAKKIIPVKIKEWKRKRDFTVSRIKLKLEFIHSTKMDFSKYFWREWVKVSEGPRLLEIDTQLSRLYRLSYLIKNKRNDSVPFDELIQEALNQPIFEVVSQYTELKRSSNRYIGLCPLHNEKSPSFFIYPETNSWFCFGCSQGGDVIHFIRLKQGFTFKEAVKFLTSR